MKEKQKVLLALLSWFDHNGRNFSWRNNNVGLYRLLVSEIFLWKTQAKTVSPFLKVFFKSYPSPRSIQEAHGATLKKDLKSLGLYNRRSNQLKMTFGYFSDKNIPLSEKEFRERFKVGQYISRSVLSIRYGQNLFPIDHNIKRFFECVFNHQIENIRNISPKDDAFLKYFIKNGGRKIIWAVIDFATLNCKRSSRDCGSCIIKRYCHHYSVNNP